MRYTVLDWEDFIKKVSRLTGKDLEVVNGTEIHRGPVHSIGYSMEKHLVFTLLWAARMDERWKTSWSVISEDEKYKIEFTAIGMQIIEWEDGRVTIDDPKDHLSATYSFLTKESNLKPVKSWE